VVRRVRRIALASHERKVEKLRAVMVDASVERQVLNCGNSPGFGSQAEKARLFGRSRPRAVRIFLGFAPMTQRSRRSIPNHLA